MEFRMTRREMLAGCLAGCLAGAGFACLSPVFAKPAIAEAASKTDSTEAAKEANEDESLSDCETESVLFEGLSVELPAGSVFKSNKDSDSGHNQYSGRFNDDLPYKIIFCDMTAASSGTWSVVTPEQLVEAFVPMDGYTKIGAELYPGDGIDTVVLYYYCDKNPDLNIGKIIVYSETQIWELEIGVQSDSGDDEAALGAIRQVAMGIKLEDAVGSKKMAALKASSK